MLALTLVKSRKHESTKSSPFATYLSCCGHSFGESGLVIPPEPSCLRHNSARSGRHPAGGVAKRSTARLRAVAGASTLLCWGYVATDDVRRPLAALRIPAALCRRPAAWPRPLGWVDMGQGGRDRVPLSLRGRCWPVTPWRVTGQPLRAGYAQDHFVAAGITFEAACRGGAMRFVDLYSDIAAAQLLCGNQG